MKLLFMLTVTCLYLFGINLDIKPEKEPIVVNKKSIQYVTEMYKTRRMHISSKNAEKVNIENKLLANKYLSESEISDDLRYSLSVSIEEQLAKAMIKKYEEKIDTSDDVLRSYYLENKEEFLDAKSAKLNIYKFTDFDKAIKFYYDIKDNINKIDFYVKDKNISFQELDIKLDRLNKEVLNLLNDLNSTNYITAPSKFRDHFIILKPIEFIPEGYQSYSKVKDLIRKKLLFKIFAKTRERILNDIRKND